MRYLLNNSGKLNGSRRKRFLPSVEMTASVVIPNEGGAFPKKGIRQDGGDTPKMRTGCDL
ncbi:hypothetical protein AUK22_11760 [bacterium CG2_30_54_10]|nr:MAG: hypothetical protein AUK22_11760 [bacterium CG2_30_54_10]